MRPQSWNRGRGLRNLVVGVVVVLGVGSVPLVLTLMGSANDDSGLAPTPTPETSDVPTGISSQPTEGPARFTDPDLGYSIAYPPGWDVQGTGNETEGVVLSIISTRGSVVIDVSRMFPPPRQPGIDGETHLRGYGQAILDMAKLDAPGFQVVIRDIVELEDGTQAFAARFAIDGDSLLAGDILVVIRPTQDPDSPFGDEAFVVRATGPAIPYLSNSRNVQTVMKGFSLVPRSEPLPGF